MKSSFVIIIACFFQVSLQNSYLNVASAAGMRWSNSDATAFLPRRTDDTRTSTDGTSSLSFYRPSTASTKMMNKRIDIANVLRVPRGGGGTDKNSNEKKKKIKSTLRMVIGGTRHGCRFANGSSPYHNPDTTMMPSLNSSFWTANKEVLTPQGGIQNINLGRRLADQYSSLLDTKHCGGDDDEGNNYIHEVTKLATKVAVLCDSSERTAASAWHILLGMFPANDNNNLSANVYFNDVNDEKQRSRWTEVITKKKTRSSTGRDPFLSQNQILPIFCCADSIIDSETLWGSDAYEFYMTNIRKFLIDLCKNSPEKARQLDSHYNTLEHLFPGGTTIFPPVIPDSPFSDANRFYAAFEIAQLMKIEEVTGLLPAFLNSIDDAQTTVTQQDQETQKWVIDTTARLYYTVYNSTNSIPCDGDVTSEVPLEPDYSDFVARAFSAHIKGEPVPNFVLLAGHDINILGFLSKIGVAPNGWPGFVACWVMELHYQDGSAENADNGSGSDSNSNEGWFVRFRYNDERGSSHELGPSLQLPLGTTNVVQVRQADLKLGDTDWNLLKARLLNKAGPSNEIKAALDAIQCFPSAHQQANNKAPL